MPRPPTAILDVDGTLVDTTYHHALAWHRAFRERDILLPLWRLHRHIGMGGDQLVASVAGEEVERRLGEDLRASEGERYRELIDETEPLDGARELVEELKRRGNPVVLASSAKEEELDHYLDLLDVRDLADTWTSSADVDRTKPHPDLVHVALEKAGGGPGVMVGDATWDCEAAKRAGLPSIGLLTGGFSERELRNAGAGCVFDSPRELRERLDETPLTRNERRGVGRTA